MPIIVVFDANLLIQSPRLTNDEWRSLIDRAQDWDLSFAVPEVALMEAVKNLRFDWKRQRDQLAGAKVGEFSHTEDLRRVIETIDARRESLEEDLRADLAGIGAEIVAPSGDLLELAKRASIGRAPFLASGKKECVCDALIWNTVLAIAKEHPDAEIWFVSENHDDFGLPGDNNWTGPNQGSRLDCPIAFHPDLAEDLAKIDALERVQYVRTISSLEQHLASRFAPLGDAQLREQIDVDVLVEKLIAVATGHHLVPREVGLDPWTRQALVATAAPAAETLQFYDGARRARAGWTARFTVTAETRIAVSGLNGEITFVEKALVYAGDLVAADDDGTLAQVAITSVDALPDDPGLILWSDPEGDPSSPGSLSHHLLSRHIGPEAEVGKHYFWFLRAMQTRDSLRMPNSQASLFDLTDQVEELQKAGRNARGLVDVEEIEKEKPEPVQPSQGTTEKKSKRSSGNAQKKKRA
ncbi:PIN domain-containing protein [Nocardia fluminea]|uniref:PIN domain-containing protein n=1 Tax=Nocardia fluminea TaxID=134984 RepID=UPI00371CC6B9